jgi:hypothetical protein
MRSNSCFSVFTTRTLRSPLFLALALSLNVLALAGCSDDSPGEAGTTTATASAGDAQRTIRLLGSKSNSGPFEESLSLKLVDGVEPIAFYVCAAWGDDEAPSGCKAPSGARLPAGASLRLEQRPPGPARRFADSPGWGTVGTSETAELSAPLSNGVTGNRIGKVTFRATLRNRAGRVLATSNPFMLTWHE